MNSTMERQHRASGSLLDSFERVPPTNRLLHGILDVFCVGFQKHERFASMSHDGASRSLTTTTTEEEEEKEREEWIKITRRT